ncbi:MAG: hypothetical protein ACREGI_03235 [Candidatus Levyibacteriota bacterium]
MDIALTILKNKLFRGLLTFFVILFGIYLVIGSIILYFSIVKQTQEYLKNTTNRVEEDLSYNNGKWDMQRYNADPRLPDTYPLYILASDGFVIDRWKPVSGFLDSSDFKHLQTFTTPQTITTPTSQEWRIYSQPISLKDRTLAVVTVSFFNPVNEDIDTIDSKLKDYANLVSSQITIRSGTLDTNAVDPREINFNYSFQVVDQFNKILIKSNNSNSIDRIPNFIDSSYVGDEFNNQGFHQIQDSKTGEKFIILATPFFDKDNVPVGVIVIGKSISFVDSILRNFIISQAIFSIMLSVLSIYIISWIIARNFTKITQGKIVKDTIQSVSFNKERSILLIDDVEVAIPYGTNQYSFCEALFSSPKKKWENDELLEKFGEQPMQTNSRKVYDAMIIINKKIAQVADVKLIVIKEKRYQINPELIQKIS